MALTNPFLSWSLVNSVLLTSIGNKRAPTHFLNGFYLLLGEERVHDGIIFVIDGIL